VLELLPYNWEWKRISEMYYNMTRSLGDIHHFAWRATSPQWAVYNPPEDAKYSHWTIEECSSKSVVGGSVVQREGRVGSWGPHSRLEGVPECGGVQLSSEIGGPLQDCSVGVVQDS